MPHTMMLIGKVARLLSGAIIEPRMLPVATITVLFAPASACPMASTNALRLASRSPAAESNGVSAIADIILLRQRISAEQARRSSAAERMTLLRGLRGWLALARSRKVVTDFRTRSCAKKSEMAVARPRKAHHLAFGVEKARRRVAGDDSADVGDGDIRRFGCVRESLRLGGRNRAQNLVVLAAGQD